MHDDDYLDEDLRSTGGVYFDFTTVRADGSAVRVLLVDTLSDGVTPTAEALEKAAIIRGARPRDELRLVPKVRGGTTRSRYTVSALQCAIRWVLGRAGR